MELASLLSLDFNSLLDYSTLAFVVGLALHVAKKCVMEKVSLTEYLLEHRTGTYLSLGSLVSTFVYMKTMHPDLPVMMYALAGYCVDSMVNKAPLTIKRLENEVVNFKDTTDTIKDSLKDAKDSVKSIKDKLKSL